MSTYAPGYKGPMTTAGPSVPRRQPTIPAPVGRPQPFLDARSPRRPPIQELAADRAAQRGGENEARGSENAMRARGLKPMDAKKIPRARRKMDR